MSARDEKPLGEFRHALGAFTTGVTVVTTRGEDGNDVGLTANSFNSVSLDPPMVLWSLGKSSLSLPYFRAAEYFAVHILSHDQESLSTRFATRGADKFADLELDRGPADIPLLTQCSAYFVCKTAYQYEGGDHIIFVGEVLDFTHCDRAPLLFHGGQYGQIAKQQKQPPLPESDIGEHSLGYLLRVSGHQLLRPLRDELARRDLSLPQHFLLASIAHFSHDTLEQFLHLLEQGDSVPSRVEVDDLLARGLIEEVDGQVRLSEAGAKLHVELASVFKASESQALRGLDFDLRQTLNLALLKLIESTRPPG